MIVLKIALTAECPQIWDGRRVAVHVFVVNSQTLSSVILCPEKSQVQTNINICLILDKHLTNIASKCIHNKMLLWVIATKALTETAIVLNYNIQRVLLVYIVKFCTF